MFNRYTGVHRGETKILTDDKDAAMHWLIDLSSIAAKVTDNNTGEEYSVNADGSIVTLPSRRTAVPPTTRQTLRTTRTFAILAVSKSTFDEIQGKLRAASYTHAFQQSDEGAVIDMHGIALQQE